MCVPGSTEEDGKLARAGRWHVCAVCDQGGVSQVLGIHRHPVVFDIYVFILASYRFQLNLDFIII